MENVYKAYYKSEIGLIELSGTQEGILSLEFVEGEHDTTNIPTCLEEGIRQLDEYFNGKRKEFTLSLIPQGTSFQLKVWEKLRKVPYGQTATYADIAKAVGNKKAMRAIGGANNKNKIAIIIPCHRIIGKSGDLTGYAGGLWRKKWLLEHELKF